MAATEANHDSGSEAVEQEQLKFDSTAAASVLQKCGYTYEQPADHVKVYDRGDEDTPFIIGVMEEQGYTVISVSWEEEAIYFRPRDGRYEE